MLIIGANGWCVRGVYLGIYYGYLSCVKECGRGKGMGLDVLVAKFLGMVTQCEQLVI